MRPHRVPGTKRTNLHEKCEAPESAGNVSACRATGFQSKAHQSARKVRQPPHGCEFGAALQRVGRVRVPRPVRCCPPQLLGQRGVRLREDTGSGGEEPLHDRPQPLGCDARLAIEAAEQRRGGVPLRWRHRKASLSQLPVKHPTGHPRQHDLAGLAAFANHVQPVIAMRIDFDGSQRRANELAGAQSSAIAEVDHKAKPLSSARLPAVRPLQTVGDRPQELPLAFGKHPRRIQGRLLGTAHLDAGEWVGQDISPLDQPSEHRAEDG